MGAATVENKQFVTVVTGAASGIGQALCMRLARRDQASIAVDNDVAALNWVGAHSSIHACAADVSTENGNEAMVAMASDRFDRLDAAVLNAAVFPARPIEAISMKDFDRLMAVNLRGVVLGIRAVLPLMRASGGGAILVTSSVAGIFGAPNNAVYAASKGGLISLVKSVAHEVGTDNIRINAICPGVTLSGGAAHPEFRSHPEYERQRQRTALKRWAEPDEIAAVMEFLISPAASYVTGAAVSVDGGWTGRTL
jgi:NAD(P)-dependent dehydrogenase (short-subunit alcohol dehydrogenase family)